MYYVLTISDEYPERFVFKYDYKNSPPAHLFMQASRIGELTTPPVYRLNGKIKLNQLMEFDFFMGGPDLISEKFSKLIQLIARDDVQLIDAEIWLNDKRIDGFKVMNVLNKVNCIDMEKSVTRRMLKSDPSSPIVVDKPVFMDGSLTSNMIARAYEDVIKTTIVSESFIQACKDNGINGVEFLPNGERSYV